jgi:hypothetical protein
VRNTGLFIAMALEQLQVADETDDEGAELEDPGPACASVQKPTVWK